MAHGCCKVFFASISLIKKIKKYYWPNEVGNFAVTTIPESLVFIIKTNMKL